MENEKGVPLKNGSRDRKSELPEDGENDPCLPGVNSRPPDRVDNKRADSTDSVGKNRSTVRRWEDGVRRRTGLSRTGVAVAAVLLALLLVFLLIIVVLAATWPRTPHSQLFPVCTHAACLQASAQILPRMNSTAPPCDDFWNYACGRWLSSRAVPKDRSQWSLAEERAFKYREHLHSMVTTLPHPKKTVSIGWKLHHLYESCLHLDSVENDRERPLKKLITPLGGWYVLREFSMHSWDYRATLVKLFSEHGVAPFFRVAVVPDPRNPDKGIIQIVPSGLHLPDRSYYSREPSDPVPSAYMTFMKDVVKLLGATSTDAARFGRDIFHYEKRIAEIMPEASELRDPVASRRIVMLGELSTTASSIPLLDILQAMFPRTGLSDSTELLVPSQRYLNKVSHIISTTDREALNNYLIWVFASAYLPYLSKEYIDAINMYRRELTGAEEPLQRWEMCVATLQQYMGFALATLSDQMVSSVERETANTEVSEMFESIRASVKDSVTKASWLQPELKRHALEKVEALTLQVGFPGRLLSNDYVESYYKDMNVMKNDLFQNVLNAVEFQLVQQRTRLRTPQEEHRWIDAMSSENGVTYVPTANKVVVPQRLLVLPFFHAQYPKSLLYGGLGVQLASAIAASVLPFGILYNGDGSLLPSNRTEINQTAYVVARTQWTMVEDFTSSRLARKSIANRTALDTTQHIAAVRHAQRALTKVLTDLPHVHQPGMETLESESLFFLTYAQNLCSHSTPQQADLDATASFHLNSSQLLPTTLKQLSEFSTVFGCGSSSVHYASDPHPEIL